MTIDALTISFPKNVNSQNFERVLASWYGKSKRSIVLIRFDFLNVEWFDIFELTLTALWIAELKKKEKQIAFVSPRSPVVKSFFSKFEFGKFLIEHEIHNDLRYTNIINDSLLSTPYFPLKFYHEESFKSLLSFLSDENNYINTFSDISDSGIIKKEYLRNIIIQELGDNMYRHGKGELANITMAKYGNPYLDKNNRAGWRSTLVKNSSFFEKSFFEKLGGNEYFTIIISDKGPGIYKTLKANFLEHNSKDRLTECNVLEYAFSEHSTSRTPTQRLGELSIFYDNSLSGAPNLPPPTGLYLLKEIVKQFHGFIYLRSGSSIISFDFLNDQVKKSSTQKGVKKLTNFAGTQIKIHFPVNISLISTIYKNYKFLFPETSDNINYKYINLGDFFKESFKGLGHEERAAIYRFFDTISTHKSNSLNQLSGIVLDLVEQSCISNKALHFVIAKMMSTQEKNYSHILININPQFVPAIKEAFRPQGENVTNRPIILFDINYKREIIGVNESEEILFNGLFAKSAFSDNLDNDFIDRHDHLFISNDYVSFKHKRRSIFNTARINLQSRLEMGIYDTKNNIFSENVKVFLPSKVYCEGYFEIEQLINNKTLKSELKQWFNYLIFDKKPTNIISISPYCNIIVDEINEERPLTSTHYKIPSPLDIDFFELFEINNKLDPDSKTLIFCDVIGTSNSLTNILKHLTHVNNLQVYTIIKATKDQRENIIINDKQIPISSIVSHELTFFVERPPNWNDKILVEVDKKTNSLVRKKLNVTLPLWPDDSQFNFINDIVVPGEKYSFGHYIHQDTHLAFLFDIVTIVKQHGPSISKKILDHYTSTQSHSLNPHTGTVLFLRDKESLRDIARSISTSLYFKISSISHDEIVLSDSYESNEYYQSTVIVLDDAFDSGNSLMKIIDFCSRRQANKIYVYAIIKRGSDYSARKLSGIRRYFNSEVTFNYLTEIDIETYEQRLCPICFNLNRLNELNQKLKREPDMVLFSDYITQQIDDLKPQRADEFYGKIHQNYYEKELIFIRSILQKAKLSLSFRNEIVKRISNYKKNFKEVLVIYRLISQENLFHIFDKKENTDKYEFEFEKSVIDSCLFIIKKLNITEQDLDSTLTILRYIDEDRFIDKLQSLLHNSSHNPNITLIIFKHLFLCNKSYIYPESVINVLKELPETINQPVNYRKVLNSIINFWTSHLNVPNLRAIEYLKQLKDCHHEMSKNINLLSGYRSSNTFLTKERIIADWTYFSHILKNLCVNLRELGEFNFANKLINTKADTLINKVKSLIDIVKSILNNSMRIQDQLNDLRPVLLNIKEVLYNDGDNLQSIIDLCQTNVVNILNYIVRINEKSMTNIVYDDDIPSNACVAFGDSNGLEAIFGNILENILVHAKASKIFSRIRINNDTNELEIFIYDDGQLSEKFQKNIGLNTCQHNASRYFGTFTLKYVDKDEPIANEGFKTVAEVKLKYIPQKQR